MCIFLNIYQEGDTFISIHKEHVSPVVWCLRIPEYHAEPSTVNNTCFYSQHLKGRSRITISLRPTWDTFDKLSQRGAESQNIKMRKTLNKVEGTEHQLLSGDKGYCKAERIIYPTGARSHKQTELSKHERRKTHGQLRPEGQ